MYIQSQYKYKVLQVIKNENWEGQFPEVTGGGLLKPVIIGNIYRPPRVLNFDYKKFNDEFASILSHIEVIIAGDFNIILLKINEKEYCSEFYTLTGFSFFPKITFPTRFSSLNGTLIDNLFGKICELMLESTAGILIKQFSDHHPYFKFTDNAPVKKCPPKLIKIHIQNEIAMWN